MSKLRAYFIEEFLAGKPLSPVQLSTREGPPKLALPSINLHVKQVGSAEDRTLEFVASDESIDRYEEVISVAGWDLKNWRKAPTFLFGHDYHSLPIGQGVKAWKAMDEETKKLRVHLRFGKAETYPLADTMYRLTQDGDLRTVSVGFLPWDWEDGEEEERDADGKSTKARRTYKKQDLLEISLVPVPANPNALVNAMQRGVLKQAEFNLLTQKYKMPAEREVIDLRTWGSLREPERAVEVESFTEEIPAVEKGAVPFKKYSKKFDEATAWDGSAARGRMAKWASSDGSGDKEKVDFKKYEEGFGWFDGENADNFGAYKLPHHDIKDGGMAHHWRGTAAAMGALLGAHGGTQMPEADHKGVFSHLSKEYEIFDKPVPDDKSYVTVEDIVSGVSDLDTALAIYEAINDTVIQDWVSPPKALTDKWPELLKEEKPDPTTIQSLILSKQVFPTKSEAQKWCTDNDFKAGEPDETDNTWRFRQFDPDQCKAGSFRTIRLTDGVQAVICKKKEAEAPEPTKKLIVHIERDKEGACRIFLDADSLIDDFVHSLESADVIWQLHEVEIVSPTSEVQLRIGAVLNKKNLERVKTIKQAAEEILAEAENPNDEPEDEPNNDKPNGDKPEDKPEDDKAGNEPVLELEAPPPAAAPAPVPEAQEFVLELEAPAPAPEAPAKETPAPPSPTSQEGQIVELDVSEFAAALDAAVEKRLGIITGDARTAQGRRRK